MFHFIRYKIKNKKLLNSSLLIGVTLLVGFLCVYPMFREGSLNKMIQNLFIEQMQESVKYPATIMRTGVIAQEEFVSIDSVMQNIDSYKNTWQKYIDCPIVQEQRVFHVKTGNAETGFGANSIGVSIGAIPDLYEYAEVVYGVKAEDAEKSENEHVKRALQQGAYPCVISQTVMDQYELVVGETLSLKLKIYDGKDVLHFVITGIVEEMEEDQYYWYNRLGSYRDLLILPEEIYSEVVRSNEIHETNYDEAVMFDYSAVHLENAVRIKKYLDEFERIDSAVSNNFVDLLAKYCQQEKSISIILFTFELPIVALLLLFLYMISGRILEMETTEIAMLKSRGVSRGKIIGLYICQSSIIAAGGCVLGIPFGFVMCRFAAGTDAFLSFTCKDVSVYRPTYSMLLFALLAFLLAVLFMTLPVIGLSKLTITQRRSARISSKNKPFWEKYFLDVLLLGVSGYLLYNYYKQSAVMAVRIISGKGVDPVIFLNSSLFILSCGLVFLRLTGYLVRLIYYLGRKHWKPASYVAFLQIIRSAKKQGFITVFLVMTIAMGVFNANLARTVNENMEQREAYHVGTDLILREQWPLVTIKIETGETLWSYKEPDFEKYNFLDAYGLVNKTKVIVDRNTDITINSKVEKGNTLMAIHTKEFGEIAKLADNSNEKHWYYYLNDLAENPNGAIISSNLASKYGLKAGDKIQYGRYSPLSSAKTYVDAVLTVVAVVDAFPGFESTVYVTNSEGKVEERENYLVVANYATVINSCSQTPYQLWMRFNGDVDYDKIVSAIEEKGVVIESCVSSQREIRHKRDSAMIQITNGMFSIGVIISLLICSVGFMIYWILTIRERNMLYGIYRAMGMTMKEIVRMLVIEQIFSSLLSALSGFCVGGITTLLFTKLIAIVYLPQKHNIPITICIRLADSIKMVIIISLAFAICFTVISHIVRKMNITKALKMGED